MGEHWSEEIEIVYCRVLREELHRGRSWRSGRGKLAPETGSASNQGIARRRGAGRQGFPGYAQQSFIDTLTLYLHGICCDIDVDTGPRQLPSRFLRKRLVGLEHLFPPPQGYAAFPEQLEP